MKIVRRPVREEIRAALLERLLSGALPPGERIDEAGLTVELGVSRTPVREALINLVHEGFLQAEMGRGFVVLPLTVEEARETYPILWTLEGLALRESDPSAVSPDLRKIVTRMTKTKDPDVMLELDTQWHEMVLMGCSNKRLLDMIKRLKGIVHRYEYAYMRDTQLVTTSHEQHTAILDAVEAGRLGKAAGLLETHWRFGMQSVVDWVQAHEKPMSAGEAAQT